MMLVDSHFSCSLIFYDNFKSKFLTSYDHSQMFLIFSKDIRLLVRLKKHLRNALLGIIRIRILTMRILRMRIIEHVL